MMNLILILIITMMTRSHSKVWQRLARLTEVHPLLPTYHLVTVHINHFNDRSNSCILLCLIDVLCGLVSKAVCRVDVLKVPETAVVKVVE